MKVRLLSAIAGSPCYAMGEVVDLPPVIAQAWIAAGLAELDTSVETALASTVVSTRVKGSR